MTTSEQRQIMLEVLTKHPAPADESEEAAKFRKRFKREVAKLPPGATMEIPSEIEVEGVDD
jgi:hypothetical protein